jgi:hypothetical protein
MGEFQRKALLFVDAMLLCLATKAAKLLAGAR